MTRPTITGTPDAVPTIELDELLDGGDLELIDRWLGQADVVQIADELSRLPRERRAVPFRLLGKDRALEVFELLDPSLQQELLEGLRDMNVRQLFEGLDPDDRARLTEEMPAKVARRLLAGLSPNERRLTSTLLGYAEDSAGRLMSPEVASLRAGMTAAQALDRLRGVGRSAETIYALPVTDDQRRLVGRAGPAGPRPRRSRHARQRPDGHHSVLGPRRRRSGGGVPPDPRGGSAGTPDRRHRGPPGGDRDGRRRDGGPRGGGDRGHGADGGAEPLRRPYLATSVLQLARSRIVWLLVFVMAGAVTVNVLAAFEGALQAAVTLTFFVPLVIGTAGNTGAQSATTVTRAVAVGEVRLSDLGPVVAREAVTGLLLGAILGAIAFGPIALLVEPGIATVVSLTLRHGLHVLRARGIRASPGGQARRHRPGGHERSSDHRHHRCGRPRDLLPDRDRGARL